MSSDYNKTWRIGLGIFAVIAVACILLRACDNALRQERMEQTAAAVKHVADLQQREKAEALRQQQVRQEQEQAARAAQEAASQQRAAQVRASIQAVQDAQADADARREAAWQRAYKRPPECENPPTDKALVECSNKAMRARERFDATYKP
jgi:hypothetical protein